MPSYATYLVLAIVSIFITTNWFLPLLARYLTRCRLTYLSLSRIKGFEWRHESHAADIVPDVRVEHGWWRYGGWNRPEGVGFIVIYASGLSTRERDRPSTPKKPTATRGQLAQSLSPLIGPIVGFVKTLIIGVPSLLIHHYPSLGGLISFHISDGRLIFDKLDGLELTWSVLKLGAKVSFAKKEPSRLSGTAVRTETAGRNSFSATTDDIDPAWPASPPDSPIIERRTHAFVFPSADEARKGTETPPRRSRLSHARRQASAISSRMTDTAGQIWSRVIGRARGHVKLTITFSDLAVILPHSNPAHPLSKPSIPDLVPQPHPQCDAHGLSHRLSSKSIKAHKVQARYSMDRLFRSVPRYALPSHEGGYERLLSLEGESRISATMRFGPRRGWLAEDTLSLDTELGKFHTSLGAWTKVQDLMQSYAREKKGKAATGEASQGSTAAKRPEDRWAGDSRARVMLRALDSVSISVSQIVVSHFLSVSNSNAGSANSSFSDLSSLASDDYFTVSLDAKALKITLNAADSSNNLRARNAFGSNANRTCRVRGIGLGLTWDTIEVDCISPGESQKERNQLLAVRGAEIEAFSSWRPHGWVRDELLFVTDPNLALVVLKTSVASVDAAGDVQLLNELSDAWKVTHPGSASTTADPAQESLESPAHLAQGLPPRLRVVVDIGHCMFVLADRVSKSKTTLSVATDGLHVGCYTTFADRVGRRKDKLSARTAFKEEEALQARRAEAGDAVDYTVPDTMLKPQLRRRIHHEQAKLLEDLIISLAFEGNLELQPINVHISIEGDGGQTDTFSLASIGRAHGIASGDVFGRQVLDLVDTARLDPTTFSGAFGLGIDSGININLWESPVLEALTAMGKAHTSTDAAVPLPRKSQIDILSRLPSGITCRLSLGLISVFIGQPDPNPGCDSKLVRGLWFQTFAVLEYAYYVNSAQTLRTRHDLLAPIRAKLKLPEDITTQALACYHHHAPAQGRAALCRLTLLETFITPIFNGRKFDEKGGTKMNFESWKWPQAPMEDGSYTSWDFIKPRNAKNVDAGVFANAVPKFDETDTNHARRPLFHIKGANIKLLVQRKSPDAELEHRFTGRSEPIALVCGMSLIYCAVLAVSGIRRIADAWKRPTKTSESIGTKPLVYFDYTVPSVTAHIAFPLKEQVFVYFGPLHVSHEESREVKANLDQMLLFVPSTSRREQGQWQELGLVKRLAVSKQLTDPSKPLKVDMEAFRVRIPVGYHISKLVLNVTVSIKALKLVLDDLRTGVFSTVKSPQAEAPKNVPNVVLSIRDVSIEAKDSPIEERLNLIWRVGLAEQVRRLELERMFDQKVDIIERVSQLEEGEEIPAEYQRGGLGPKHTRSIEEARYNLDLWYSNNWIARFKAAQEEQKRREQLASAKLHATSRDLKLPISIAPPSLSAPLVRAAFTDFKISIKNTGLSRDEIIDYMGDVSTPFDDNTEFSLMVPIQLGWEMGSARMSLRDYPLPLINIRPTDNGSPAWTLDTLFIIAEELHGEDSTMYVPCEIVPAGMGHTDALPFTVQVFKTISPVKTYTRPHVKVHSTRTTEFTWGNSMQPAIQDFMKVIETLSHPPRDPSSRIGFWDKFRLILHWVVKVDFIGPVHLHLKGSHDPYLVDGHGAGFALAWYGGTQLRICEPNEQGETIQIIADQLLVAIPDLDALNDKAALGTEQDHDPEKNARALEEDLISRRYSKPCARFMNGVRVGFGFRFERACRAHECTADCGSTHEREAKYNYMHRVCRITHFKRHQDVILRSPEAVMRDELKLGRVVDSYEGFRSDHVHFSVSLTSPLKDIDPDHPQDSSSHNSFHFSPKGFAHFFAWWGLFNHVMSLPIRQGKLFPDSPPPSKKFGRSLGTIKYRFDLQPVYVSHMYEQISRQLWDQGKTQSLGVKARFGRLRADLHQRQQEKMVRHKMLRRVKPVTHKPFYAADLILEDIEVKGIRAEFKELPRHLVQRRPSTSSFSSKSSTNSVSDADSIEYVKSSQMSGADRAWFNLYDFVDADKRPFDHDPKIEMVDVADCPEVFLSRRTRVRQATPVDEETIQTALAENEWQEEDRRKEMGMPEETESRIERDQLETSKFGEEPTHVCYLRENKGVAPIQIKITKDRIKELQDKVKKLPSASSPTQEAEIAVYTQRLKTLHAHVKDLESGEARDIDGNTFQDDTSDHESSESFENVAHVHCPRIYWTNRSRNIAFQYFFSYNDRKEETMITSHRYLRTIREGIEKRIKGEAEAASNANKPSKKSVVDQAQNLLSDLKQNLHRKNAEMCFQLPVDNSVDHADLRKPSLGVPAECMVKPYARFLLLKPQITLRSEADDDAIVLLAVEEFSLRTFKVIDKTAKEGVDAVVLTRNYGSMKGLQAFYPNAQTLARERAEDGTSRGLCRVPALPLEIFLDIRSEATDYDRIILKTDAAISMDNFNKLRVLRGLKYPKVNDEFGEPITHLESHMNQITLIVPRIALSATSKHYSALYCVVTDLLMYQDPDFRHRNELVNDFLFQFDRRDRDPAQLLANLDNLQSSIRHLRDIVNGYERHLDRLDDEGKLDLFTLREHLFAASEQLFCVKEVIQTNKDRDEARLAQKDARKLDVRAGGIAWHLLQDNMQPLLKLDIDGTMLSVLSNKDGSMDVASVISDLSALNSNPDVLFAEVAVRYGTSSVSKSLREPMASVLWSTVAKVGGIPIVRQLSVYLHPVRLQLEEKVAAKIKDYIFNDRVSRRKEAASEATSRKETATNHGNKTSSTLELAPLHRSKSAISVNSTAASSIGNRSVSTSGRPGSVAGDDRVPDNFTMVPKGDAAEMRRRASAVRTFIDIAFESTIVVISYKRDDTKKHKPFATPDMVEFKLKTPRFAYSNKVISFEELTNRLQKDAIQQLLTSSSMYTQVVRKTAFFRTKKSLKALASHVEPSVKPSGGLLGSPSSRLKFAIESPSSVDHEDERDDRISKASTKDNNSTSSHGHGHTIGSPISRVVSRLSQSGGHLISPSSPSSSAERNASGSGGGSFLSKSPSTSMLQRDRYRDREPSEPPDSMPSDEHEDSGSDREGGNIGRAVKGFIDKFKNRKDSIEPSSRRGSYDESHFTSIGRMG